MDQNEVSDFDLIVSVLGRFTAAECILLAKEAEQYHGAAVSGCDIRERIGGAYPRRRWNIPDQAQLLAHIRRMMSYYDIRCVRFGQDGYPSLLSEIYDPPFLLFFRGDCSILEQCCGAVVGTRRPSVEGYTAAFNAGNVLGQRGITVVSGLAFGIDAAAHKGCLAGKGRTAAVLPCGLETVSPRSNKMLAADIIETGGVLLSEYVPGYSVQKYSFPQRNRIISGVSSGVFVAQAPEKSGALITADFAVNQGRGVYVLETLLEHPLNAGCKHLADDGAVALLSVDQLVNAVQCELHLETKKAAAKKNNADGRCQPLLFDDYA